MPRFAVVAALVAGSALALAAGQTATAGIVPTVPLATSAGFSVLGGQTVTNTGPSVLARSVGLSPGTSITGFPPGIVTPPATIQAANAVTLQAQSDLTIAYLNAAGRPVEFTQTNPDLVGQTLLPGVYEATAKAPLALSGRLVLDGQNNPNAVFIFQTNSTLITSSASTIELINGASACNVFWQVGSSATLGSNSVFVGTILALTSITVNNGVVVHGRALARNGSVTLINDTFTSLPCDSAAPATTTTTTTIAPATTTPATTTPATTTPGAATTVAAGVTVPGATPTVPAGVTVPEATPTVPSGVTVPAPPVATDLRDVDRDLTTTSFVFTPTDVTLPTTGTGSLVTQSGVGFAVLLIGLAALIVARRRQPA